MSKRENLKHLLNRYIFYSISTWPSSMREILEHDTITDKNTFKVILFLYDNEISLNVFKEYLYTFILNTPPKMRKRTHQLQWIITNINTHQHKWYYFDMYHHSFLLFDGLKSGNTHLTSKQNYITSHTQPNMNTCITYTQVHTHIYGHYPTNKDLLNNNPPLHFTGHDQPS